MILRRSIGNERYISKCDTHEGFCDQYGYTDDQTPCPRDTLFTG